MRRYLLFGWTERHASGGWFDWLADFNELGDAILDARGRELTGYHIVDTQDGSIVAQS